MFDFNFLLDTPLAAQWKSVTTAPRSGVAVPLFSIYSSKSVGIGDFSDLKLLIDWAKLCRLGIIQLLPLNDVGFRFTPYDSESAFALDPMYLSLLDLHLQGTKDWTAGIDELRNIYPAGGSTVHYGIKSVKLDFLRKVFEQENLLENPSFAKYCVAEKDWLDAYACFKALKDHFNGQSWEVWPETFRDISSDQVRAFSEKFPQKILFYKWLQWQCLLQFRSAFAYASAKNILIFGDIPLLVSRDSADVWSNQKMFQLDLASGAPPDSYCASGQRWGMPPYDWPTVEASGYEYFRKKLRYSENFYHLFRIDHVVGIYRLWSIPVSEPLENQGLNGFFDPRDESIWQDQGRRFFDFLSNNTRMLPCAEDLGIVPDFSAQLLSEFGIPGMDVQRWIFDWNSDRHRCLSISLMSSHDMSSFRSWWLHEAETIDVALFEFYCEQQKLDSISLTEKLFTAEGSIHGRLRWRHDLPAREEIPALLSVAESQIYEILSWFDNSFHEREKFCQYLGLDKSLAGDFSQELIVSAMEKLHQSPPIFSIQLLTDWLDFLGRINQNPWEFRINFPGLVSEANWSLVYPYSLEEMLDFSDNKRISDLVLNSGRATP